MDIGQAITVWGYPLVAFGAFMQGEVILLFAGYAAYLGHLDYLTVVGVAYVASIIGNQWFFFLGRRYGNRLLQRWPGLRPPVARFTSLLQRFQTPLILVMRLLYGLSMAGPIALGLTSISRLRFFILNLIGGLPWAFAIAGLGYQFGHLLDKVISTLQQVELLIVIVLVVALLLYSRRRDK